MGDQIIVVKQKGQQLDARPLLVLYSLSPTIEPVSFFRCPLSIVYNLIFTDTLAFNKLCRLPELLTSSCMLSPTLYFLLHKLGNTYLRSQNHIDSPMAGPGHGASPKGAAQHLHFHPVSHDRGLLSPLRGRPVGNLEREERETDTSSPTS